jgi:predicted transglutaminase-like cysteine proteinase
MNTKYFLVGVGVVAAFAFVPLLGAPYQETVAEAGFMPPAFPAFCRAFPKECIARGPVVRLITLTPERERELHEVDNQVNRTIKQVADIGDVWSLPINGRGDCEDLALLKRQKLIALGWPSSVLLMTVARDREGYGHAILTVVTDKGDYILDNLTSRIRLAAATGYTFYSRQATYDPKAWVNIAFKPIPIITGSIGPKNLATEDDAVFTGLYRMVTSFGRSLQMAGDWIGRQAVALATKSDSPVDDASATVSFEITTLGSRVSIAAKPEYPRLAEVLQVGYNP